MLFQSGENGREVALASNCHSCLWRVGRHHHQWQRVWGDLPASVLLCLVPWARLQTGVPFYQNPPKA